jgi:secreted trypsin-like serine protease
LHEKFVPALHTVQLGKLDLRTNSTTPINAKQSQSGLEEEILIVEKNVVHPHFNLETMAEEPPYPDIAILKLYGNSKINEYVKIDNPQLVSDWTQQQQLSELQLSQREFNFTTMGYGLDESQSASNVLKQTTVTYVPNDICKTRGLWELLHQDMMCATGEGARDSCSGDSGGPLFWKNEEGKVMQVGIVSWGIGCADPKYPGVCE